MDVPREIRISEKGRVFLAEVESDRALLIIIAGGF